MKEKDTLITLYQTTTTAYNVRIRGECSDERLQEYQNAAESTESILDAIHALEDEGATVLVHDANGTVMDTEIEWSTVRKVEPLPGQMTIETTITLRDVK